MATRYRLRFLLQEFDLARGATLIGRSAECHVTIEDPLVSRQHAKIVITGDEAVFEDLGSRNGVKVNGTALRGSVRLKDGDRLRIGTQELVFCEVETGIAPPAKTTGFLRYCAACRLPYPQELAACPACGATEQTDEDTLSGQFGASSKQAAWSVQLLVEVTEKALTLGRTSDAVRMLQRAKVQLEERVASGGAAPADQIEGLVRSAMRVALAAEDPAWAAWGLHLYDELRLFPSSAVVEAFAEVGRKYPTKLAKSAEELLTALRARPSETPLATAAASVLAELERLVASLGELAGEADADADQESDTPNPANPNLD
ncbi:FHA domain-containing protein [Pendulispora rubella]|uniref:FHA domain-containing protein n=1 Tax=Pendulispora rubella TaxID=2741070 RepID=A0ABZ2LE58_9BACT